MGIELAKAFITVRADASRVDSDFQDVKQQVNSTMDGIVAGAAALLAPIAMFGKGILTQGLALAGSFEQTTVEMQTMLGSAEETRKTLDRLTRFAVETPFEMPQLLSLTRQLIAFDERGGQLFSTLKMLGDASGGSAEKFGLLGLVFNQIRGVGHLLTQDFRQLSTRGIISLQDIAKYYKKTTTEAQAMLSSGKISFEDFRKILKGLTEEGGRFANGMEKQSKTMEGLKSTMRDSLNITKRMIAEPLAPYMKMIYSTVIQAADALGIFVKQGGEAVSLAFVGSTAFATFGAAIAGTTIILRLFGVSWMGFLLGFFGIGPLVLAAGAAVGLLVYGLKQLSDYIQLPRLLSEGWKHIQQLLLVNQKEVDKLIIAFENLKQVGTIVFEAMSAAMAGWWFNSQGKIEDMKNDFDTAFVDMLKTVADFALGSSEWILAIAMHWRELWDEIPKLAEIAYSYIEDIQRNMLVEIGNAFIDVWQQLIDKIEKIAEWVALLFAGTDKWTQKKEELTKDEEDQIRGSIKRGAAAKMRGFFGEKMDVSEFAMSRETKNRIAAMANRVRTTVEDTKRDLEKRRAVPIERFQVPDKDALKGAENPLPMVKAGIYDIAAFGKKFQEAALQGKETPAMKTNNLLELNNKIQEKQLQSSLNIERKLGLA